MGKKRMGKKAWSPSCATSRARWARRRARAPSRRRRANCPSRLRARRRASPPSPRRTKRSWRAEKARTRPGLRVALCGTGCVGGAPPPARRGWRARRRASGARRRAARWRTRRRRAQGFAFAAEARLASALGALRDWRSRTAERRGMAELARLAAAGAFRKRARLAFDAWRGEASSASARARRMRDSRRKPSGFRGKPNFVVSREPS